MYRWYHSIRNESIRIRIRKEIRMTSKEIVKNIAKTLPVVVAIVVNSSK